MKPAIKPDAPRERLRKYGLQISVQWKYISVDAKWRWCARVLTADEDWSGNYDSQAEAMAVANARSQEIFLRVMGCMPHGALQVVNG